MHSIQLLQFKLFPSGNCEWVVLVRSVKEIWTRYSSLFRCKTIGRLLLHFVLNVHRAHGIIRNCTVFEISSENVWCSLRDYPKASKIPDSFRAPRLHYPKIWRKYPYVQFRLFNWLLHVKWNPLRFYFIHILRCVHVQEWMWSMWNAALVDMLWLGSCYCLTFSQFGDYCFELDFVSVDGILSIQV